MKIELYTRDNCSWCEKTKEFLNFHKIQYIQHDIGKNDLKREDVLAKFPDARTLPIVVVDDKWIGGYLELVTLLNK